MITGALCGKRVLITGAKAAALSLASALQAAGAEAFSRPLIDIQAPTDAAAVTRVAQAMPSDYAWAVFTSANGAEHFCAAVKRYRDVGEAFAGVRVAAVGPRTAAALRACGLHVDCIAQEHRQEALADELVRTSGGTLGPVLLARAEVARAALPQALSRAGARVVELAVYKTVRASEASVAELVECIEAGAYDVVTLLSSSAAEHLCDALGGHSASRLGAVCVASIGPVTTATAQERGVRVDVTASEYTAQGLVNSLEKWFSKRNDT
jgi:uroporphyrinogen III methyltransferase/synthase